MLLLLLFLVLFIFPNSTFAATTVTASIGQNRVTITGYTSPISRVELSSPKVFAVTYSDENGYFIFDKTFLPQNPADLCLTSYDDNNRQSTPTCIPAPPQTNYHTDIGPILLAPTISLENDTVDPNTTVITSGQSIPNSQISIHFYKVNDSAQSFLSLLKPKIAYAYSLPSITAISDSLGNFSINIPTAYASDYRLYASTKFQDDYSPKSNTLIYILPSLLYIFIQQHLYLIIFLPIYIISIALLFYLIKISHHPKPHYLPAVQNSFLMVQNFLPAPRHVELSNPIPTLSLDRARI
jgi:hypothetical protein